MILVQYLFIVKYAAADFAVSAVGCHLVVFWLNTNHHMVCGSLVTHKVFVLCLQYIRTENLSTG